MTNKLDDFVKAYEGNITFDYDNNILLNWYPKRIISENNKKELKLLELGLGHGYSTTIFAETYNEHTVLDGSPAVIKHFKAKHPECKVNIIETYFEEFKSDEKYDLIVMGFILEHVDNPVQILKHFKTYLKEDGILYAAVPNAEVMNRRLGLYTGILKNIEELSDNDYLLGHQRYYTKKSFEVDFIKAGYKVASIEGIYLKPLASAQMQSLNLSEEIKVALCQLGIQYPELSCGLMIKATH